MYAIASLLDMQSDQSVRELWSRFEQRCGLTGIKVTPLPHFSWQGADAYQLEPVEEILTEMAREIQPFSVQANGLGIFPGKFPVVYIPIVKNIGLFELHRILWERCRPFSVVPNTHYDPERWMPHITIAYRDSSPERLGCAIADIAFEKLSFDIQVDHFAIIYQTDGRAGLHRRFDFSAS